MSSLSPALQAQANRNRVNQRNHRARRQEYVRELEQQLRKYESEKVQATTEDQMAARLMKEQNLKLRLLLKSRLGVSDKEIDGYLLDPDSWEDVSAMPPSMDLRGADADDGGLEDARPTAIPHGQIRHFLVPPETAAPAVRDHVICQAPLPQLKTQHEPTSNPPAASENLRSAPLDRPAGPPGSQLRLDSKACEGSEQHPHHDLSQPSHGNSSVCAYANETSCEEAARIIASLRAREVSQEIWSELGCSTKKTCKVKNLSIFQLMDRE